MALIYESVKLKCVFFFSFLGDGGGQGGGHEELQDEPYSASGCSPVKTLKVISHFLLSGMATRYRTGEKNRMK